MIAGNPTITIGLYCVHQRSHIRNYTAEDFFCLSQNRQLFCNAFYNKVCRLFYYRDYAAAFRVAFPAKKLDNDYYTPLLQRVRPLLSHADIRERTENSKNVQEPEDNDNDHDGIQDRLDRARHWDESVDEPENNTGHDQDY